MGQQRMISGCLVLKEAPAHELFRYKVVLCEIRVPLEAMEEIDTYVVWYIDHKDKPSRGRFFKTQVAAHAEFARRT